MSGLIDPGGYFWRDPDNLQRHLALKAPEIVQIADRAGVRGWHGLDPP